MRWGAAVRWSCQESESADEAPLTLGRKIYIPVHLHISEVGLDIANIAGYK